MNFPANFPPKFPLRFPVRLPARGVALAAALLVAAGCWTARVVGDEPGASPEAAREVKSADGETTEEKPYVPKTKQELRRTLTPLQFAVTQNEDTEPAFRNKYWNNKKDGTYECIVCGQELFSSKTKYRSGTGWPSFYAPTSPKQIGTRTDYRLFFPRTEVHCSRCKAHLGHVFDDGPQPTGLRYCMNSASLKFVEQSNAESSDAADDASENKAKQ